MADHLLIAIDALKDRVDELKDELTRYKTALEKAREALAEVCNTRCYEKYNVSMTRQALAEIETVLKGE